VEGIKRKKLFIKSASKQYLAIQTTRKESAIKLYLERQTARKKEA
jgi:hypothetical protein